MKKDQSQPSGLGKKKKPYHTPQLQSEKVFASDALGGCRLTGASDGCGDRSPQYWQSSV